MDEQHNFETIDATTFESLLAQYGGVVPEKLAVLERQRLEVIPLAIKERDPTHITKDELATLMDWKLAHGKFRPSLQKLIQDNEEDAVQTHSTECFKRHALAASSPPAGPWVKQLMSIVSKLRGVGPATATLLLSVYDPVNIPFYSDELFRWAMWDEPATPKGSGWKRDIKYTIKEYLELYSKVQELRTRLTSESGKEVSALDTEKVAYVLGKQADPPPPPAAPPKRNKGKAPVKDAGDVLPWDSTNPAFRAWARRFEVSILGEERVAELDREEVAMTAEEREEDAAFADTPFAKDLVTSIDRAFGTFTNIPSEQGDVDAEGPVSPEQEVMDDVAETPMAGNLATAVERAFGGEDAYTSSEQENGDERESPSSQREMSEELAQSPIASDDSAAVERAFKAAVEAPGGGGVDDSSALSSELSSEEEDDGEEGPPAKRQKTQTESIDVDGMD
ncbi:hypothetical protein LTR36_005142 [Oleoguttula mirabilis]|uniref:Uncharacterized protein n=1 Tax=Oleoguttula mirabilis TaxID=1507867 RepID=A0AAV9JW66_9PEZI|nr:hypothetical protein LTR36_005142 [Oleoguttula mirabilis]